MKIIIFDVGNAACSVISSPNEYGLMIDCGSHSEKENPIDLLKSGAIKKWLGLKDYVTQNRESFKLGLLHVTHPDDDHVRNAKRIKEEFAPYLLYRRKFEEFPDADKINDDYKKKIDLVYRGNNPETIDWGFEINKTFKIPMDILKNNEELNKKLCNNSSILRYIKYNGIKILFSGDLEKEGWEWLTKNDQDFINTMKNGLDILIAPHHGHKSGFPTSLFDLTGNIKISILSKASESENENTDVSSQYSQYSIGIPYLNLNDEQFYFANSTLTTRSNGGIYIKIGQTGSITIITQKASPNHSKIPNQ